MRHYLNVCSVDGRAVEPVDIITFGSPCQDLSVAGKREGLKHDELGDGETTRSGLFMEAVRIIKEMREKTDGKSPTFAIWENVPGAFSSQKGEDFRVVLEELAKIKASDAAVPRPPKGKWADAGAIMGDGWSVAWRVLDAQFHGVPQRRRRILLVADFAGERAGEILFECSGLPGYPAESGAARQGAAGDATGGTGAKACGIGWQEECAPTLKGVMSGGNTVPTACIPINDKATRYRGGGDSRNGDGCGNGLGIGKLGDPSPTLTVGDHHAVCLDCRNLVGNTEISATLQAKVDGGFSLNYINPVVVYDARGNGDGAIVPTITGDHEGHISDYTALAYREDADTYISARPAYSIGNGQVDSTSLNEEVVGTLNCMHDQQAVISHVDEYAVRRLTPTECARLQGFPDWWGELPTIESMDDEQYRFWCADLMELAKIEQTARWDDLMGCLVVWRLIKPDKSKNEVFAPYWQDTGTPYKSKSKKQMVAWYNKLHTDSAECKMWGNGVALPVVRVPLHEMAKLGAKTLGSLFDGSGGFPLAGILEGITPLWASEIEPYTIAVTRARFGDATMRELWERVAVREAGWVFEGGRRPWKMN